MLFLWKIEKGGQTMAISTQCYDHIDILSDFTDLAELFHPAKKPRTKKCTSLCECVCVFPCHISRGITSNPDMLKGLWWAGGGGGVGSGTEWMKKKEKVITPELFRMRRSAVSFFTPALCLSTTKPLLRTIYFDPVPSQSLRLSHWLASPFSPTSGTRAGSRPVCLLKRWPFYGQSFICKHFTFSAPPPTPPPPPSSSPQECASPHRERKVWQEHYECERTGWKWERERDGQSTFKTELFCFMHAMWCVCDTRNLEK